MMEVEDQTLARSAEASLGDSKPGAKFKGKGKAKAASPVELDDEMGGGSDVDMRDVDVVSGTVSGAAGFASSMPGGVGKGGASSGGDKAARELDMVGVLDCIPREPVYVVWPTVPSDTEGGGGASAGGDGKLEGEPGERPDGWEGSSAVVLPVMRRVGEWLCCCWQCGVVFRVGGKGRH